MGLYFSLRQRLHLWKQKAKLLGAVAGGVGFPFPPPPCCIHKGYALGQDGGGTQSSWSPTNPNRQQPGGWGELRTPPDSSPGCDFLLLLPCFLAVSFLLLLPLEMPGNSSLVIKKLLAAALCHKDPKTFSHSFHQSRLLCCHPSERSRLIHSLFQHYWVFILVGGILRWPPRYLSPPPSP